MAAEVLHDVLRAGRPGALSAASLARYEEAWPGRLGTEIDAGLDLQAAAREMSDELRRLRKRVLAAAG